MAADNSSHLRLLIKLIRKRSGGIARTALLGTVVLPYLGSHKANECLIPTQGSGRLSPHVEIPKAMNSNFNEVRAPRSYDEIMLAARQMRADHLRDLFGKLRANLFGARAGHGTALPSVR